MNLVLTFPLSEQTTRKISFRWRKICTRAIDEHFVWKISFSSFYMEAFCFEASFGYSLVKYTFLTILVLYTDSVVRVWERVYDTVFFTRRIMLNGFLLNSSLEIQIMALVNKRDDHWVSAIILRNGRDDSISLFCHALVESLCGFLENRFIWKLVEL